MKPIKKQIKPDAKKKHFNDKNDKKIAPGIQTFFQSAPKSYIVEQSIVEGNSNDDAKKLFVDILKKKLQDINDGEDGRNEDELSQPDVGSVQQQESNKVGPKQPQINFDVNELKFTGEAGDAQNEEGKNVRPNQPQINCDGNELECADECSRSGCVERDRKYKELKKVYMNLTVYCSELSMKHQHLLKAVKNIDNKDDADVVISSDDVFTQNEIKVLQGLSLEKPKDSTFILESLQYAYKSDTTILLSKTFKGTLPWVEIAEDGQEIHHAAKSPLTPKKVDRIKGLFIERISKCGIDSANYGERIKDSYVNRLFATAIKNITKKKK